MKQAELKIQDIVNVDAYPVTDPNDPAEIGEIIGRGTPLGWIGGLAGNTDEQRGQWIERERLRALQEALGPRYGQMFPGQ